mgnify:CR=1 FL=1
MKGGITMNATEKLYIQYVEGMEDEIVELLALQYSSAQLAREIGIPRQQLMQLYEHEEFIALLKKAKVKRKVNLNNTIAARKSRPDKAQLFQLLVSKLHDYENVKVKDIIQAIEFFYPEEDANRTHNEGKNQVEIELKNTAIDDELVNMIMNSIESSTDES